MRGWILLIAILGLTVVVHNMRSPKKTMRIVSTEVPDTILADSIPALEDQSPVKESTNDFKALTEAISVLTEQVGVLVRENNALEARVADMGNKLHNYNPVVESPDKEEDWYSLIQEQQKINSILSEQIRLKMIQGDRLTEELADANRTIETFMSVPPDIPESIIVNDNPTPSIVNPTDKWPKYKNTIQAGYMYANGVDMWGATYARNFTGFLGIYGGVYVDQNIKTLNQVFPVGGIKVSFK